MMALPSMRIVLFERDAVLVGTGIPRLCSVFKWSCRGLRYVATRRLSPRADCVATRLLCRDAAVVSRSPDRDTTSGACLVPKLCLGTHCLRTPFRRWRRMAPRGRTLSHRPARTFCRVKQITWGLVKRPEAEGANSHPAASRNIGRHTSNLALLV